jgi:hypothetical protein
MIDNDGTLVIYMRFNGNDRIISCKSKVKQLNKTEFNIEILGLSFGLYVGTKTEKYTIVI